MINGGEYSAVTDGFALGMTLLGCLTNRSPIAMVDRCEAEFGKDWDAIRGEEIAGGTMWPADVADAVTGLCFAGAGRKSLCADRRRNRSTIEPTMQALRALQPHAIEFTRLGLRGCFGASEPWRTSHQGMPPALEHQLRARP